MDLEKLQNEIQVEISKRLPMLAGRFIFVNPEQHESADDIFQRLEKDRTLFLQSKDKEELSLFLAENILQFEAEDLSAAFVINSSECEMDFNFFAIFVHQQKLFDILPIEDLKKYHPEMTENDVKEDILKLVILHELGHIFFDKNADILSKFSKGLDIVQQKSFEENFCDLFAVTMAQEIYGDKHSARMVQALKTMRFLRYELSINEDRHSEKLCNHHTGTAIGMLQEYNDNPAFKALSVQQKIVFAATVARISTTSDRDYFGRLSSEGFLESIQSIHNDFIEGRSSKQLLTQEFLQRMQAATDGAGSEVGTVGTPSHYMAQFAKLMMFSLFARTLGTQSLVAAEIFEKLSANFDNAVPPIVQQGLKSALNDVRRYGTTPFDK